jgi:hypothetical protein
LIPSGAIRVKLLGMKAWDFDRAQVVSNGGVQRFHGRSRRALGNGFYAVEESLAYKRNVRR